MPSPGGSDERLTVFLARADLSGAGGIHGQPDEGEDIRVVTVAVAEIPALLASGLLDNAASIIALQWLQLHKSDIDARWRAAR
jgi:ADP-ribose pyrophosphatase